MTILVVASNRPPHRFYRGGRRITDFRGVSPAAEDEPEDWVASVTPVAGGSPSGRTTLDDGRLLADAITADPVFWLGEDHAAAFGADPMLLVKLLDAGQRLPVHAHPTRGWAAEHLAAAHGKTEAWYVLTPGVVHLGLTRDLGPGELDGIVVRQDAATLLDAMHRVEVHPGDVVHVPAGVLHAIGEGILLIELQEPEDLSILVEWRGFAIDGAREGHLGVGFATALGAVETRARSVGEIGALVHRADARGPLLPDEAAPFFRLDRLVVDGAGRLDAGYAVLVVVSGAVVAVPEADAPGVRLTAGATALVPCAAGRVTLEGSGEVLVARPPSPVGT